NFAAGMSGGIAYLYNPDNNVDLNNFNMELIKLEEPSIEDQEEFKELIEKHYQFTESKLAKKILDNWKENSGKFIKVMPIEYKKALQKLKEEKMIQDKTELKTA
ncbi:MAG: hypothetical protein MUP24_04170, partial [Gillisia sp.]|nr:hypothetical protein [Gillisia sp.]